MSEKALERARAGGGGVSGGVSVSRRRLLAGSVAGVAALAAPAVVRAQSLGDRFNLLFVFSDQERYFPAFPPGFSLPGHERLARLGVTFRNHYCPAAFCTSARSVLMTGLQTADNKMADNINMPWQGNLSTRIATYGDILDRAGVYPAYKGKFHLTDKLEQTGPLRLLVDEMKDYGFRDYFSVGDTIGYGLGGYQNDHMVAGNAIRWLRTAGKELNAQTKPWALTVSFVNPHDIMYFNTDAAGQDIQDTGRLMLQAERAPDHHLYKQVWDIEPPASLRQSFATPARPEAHGEYRNAWGYVLGRIPLEDERWLRLSNYYLNCIRHVDMQMLRVLDELDALGLTDRTIIVYTSDHGEMAGAHGLRGKGPYAYEECTHLPLMIAHPDIAGGQDVVSLTSHIDIAPSLLSLMGVSRDLTGTTAGRDLPGRDFSGVLSSPRSAGLHAVREAALYTFSSLLTVDSALAGVLADGFSRGLDAGRALGDFQPDLTKRGSLRAICDGRYKFARYFAPVQRNEPATLRSLYAYNDVELYDLRSDPAETRNLAARRGDNDELALLMNAKMARVMKEEFGPDDGREMPSFEGVDWAVDKIDM